MTFIGDHEYISELFLGHMEILGLVIHSYCTQNDLSIDAGHLKLRTIDNEIDYSTGNIQSRTFKSN
jgi:hypothetical protein